MQAHLGAVLMKFQKKPNGLAHAGHAHETQCLVIFFGFFSSGFGISTFKIPRL